MRRNGAIMGYQGNFKGVLRIMAVIENEKTDGTIRIFMSKFYGGSFSLFENMYITTILVLKRFRVVKDIRKLICSDALPTKLLFQLARTKHMAFHLQGPRVWLTEFPIDSCFDDYSSKEKSVIVLEEISRKSVDHTNMMVKWIHDKTKGFTVPMVGFPSKKRKRLSVYSISVSSKKFGESTFVNQPFANLSNISAIIYSGMMAADQRQSGITKHRIHSLETFVFFV